MVRRPEGESVRCLEGAPPQVVQYEGARSRTEYETPEGTDPEEIPRRQSWNLLRGHAQNTKQAQLKDY
jgi:hypothetical protein